MPSRKARQPDAAAKLEWVNRQLRRWQIRATRANNMVAKLLKTQRRIMVEFDYAPVVRATAAPSQSAAAPPEPSSPDNKVEAVPLSTEAEVEPDIPTFLDRRTKIEKRDAKALAELNEAIAKRKIDKAKVAAEKRKVRKEKIDAKLTGKTKAMPLTGNAALKFIQNQLRR